MFPRDMLTSVFADIYNKTANERDAKMEIEGNRNDTKNNQSVIPLDGV